MKIVFCGAEVVPFTKAGGLGDVMGSLPKALSMLGHQLSICTPRHGTISLEEALFTEDYPPFYVDYYGHSHLFRVLTGVLPGSTIPVYLLDNKELFGQYTEIYPNLSEADNAYRFELFSKAACLFLTQFSVDIVHLNDWHVAPMATFYRDFPTLLQNAKLVLTLHNLAHQGITPYHNWLKEALDRVDLITAVSPNYAAEIVTPLGGAGLDDMLRHHQSKLIGILNGIDIDLFNPQTDPFLSMRYSVDTVQSGKADCKKALQHYVGLPAQPDIPLFTMVSRFVPQKGLDLILPLLPKLAQLKAQFVFIGGGNQHYEKALMTPYDNIRTHLGLNLALAQQAYAGADLFLMPSLFEPCGLSQMISLRYGTLPIARKTGGLADTVYDASLPGGNGFLFESFEVTALENALQRALELFEDTEKWQTLRQQGMRANYSWQNSAVQYVKAYQQLLEGKSVSHVG
jgi:starch synthase